MCTIINGVVHAKLLQRTSLHPREVSRGCRVKIRVAVAGPMESVVCNFPSWELRQCGNGDYGVAERRRPSH
jgi:hypothetical protein